MEKECRRKKKTLLWALISLLIIAGAFWGLKLYVDYFNSTVHSVDVKLDKWGESGKQDRVEVAVMPRIGATNTWTKNIDIRDKDGNVSTVAYRGTVYDMTLTNYNEEPLSDWSVTFVADELSYLNNAWCGKVEIHQHAGTEKEFVQTLDLRNPGTVSLDVRKGEDDLMIVLEPGDYFIYRPSKVEYEAPLRGTASGLAGKATTGFILYTPDAGDSSMYTFSNVIVTYDTSRNIHEYTLYWVLLALSFIWLVYVISSILSEIRLRAMVRAKRKDEKIIEETMGTFTGFIDAKDPYTRGHSQRVATYSANIAKKLGYSEDEVRRIYYIALLHDCGKIGVPEDILSKPGKLEPYEFEAMKQHTVKGYEILQSYTSISDVAIGAKYHHERYDGKGYPEGLKGEDIPIVARIICVADSFDAMNSDRVYRKRMEPEKIISELENNRDMQFDSKIVDVMLNLIHEGKIEFGE